MQRCQKCRADAPDYARFCGRCGYLFDITSRNEDKDRQRTSPNKQRWAFVLGAIALALLFISGGIAYAGFSNAATPSAVVTITPASADIQHTYSISAVTGTPDSSKQQVGARLLSSTTPARTRTVPTTGVVNTSGTQATGTLTFFNKDTSHPVKLDAGTLLANSFPAPIHMVLDASVTVPVPQPGFFYGVATTSAHAMEAGTVGNIPKENSPGTGFRYNSPSGTWMAINITPFSGGQDPQHYKAVQQSDIDRVANPLKANRPDPQQVLQGQLYTNERFIASPECKPKVTADHAVGDRAINITVTVLFICTGEVYDLDGALSLAATLLNNQATTDLGPGYNPVGNITTQLTRAVLVAANRVAIALTVTAVGTWVFQFSANQQEALVKMMVGKKKQDVLASLATQKGIEKIDIQLSGGDGNTLPTDASQIKIVIPNRANTG